MKYSLIFLALLFFVGVAPSFGQDVTVNVNTLSVADGALNAGVGYALDNTHTLHLNTSLRPWSRSERKVKKYWSLQPEYRLWTCQKFNGSFFGAYVHGAQFNVGGVKYPLGFASDVYDHRYDGWLAGGGLSYGYAWMLNQNWNIEASLGVGYTYINYTKFACPLLCARILDKGNHHYFGPNKCSISIVYLF